MTRFARSIFRTLSLALGCVLGMPLVMYFYQEKLIFHPPSLALAKRVALAGKPGVEELEFAVPGGDKLHGWLVRSGTKRRAPLAMYFGGNAEDISGMIDESPRLRGWAVALVNYRGYGDSTGEPSEAALFADALTVHDYLAQRPDIDAQRVVVIGRSLGSGVAVHLARERAVLGVVLISPYESVRAIAKSRYPFVPVDWLLKHPFDSLAKAPAVVAPMLALVARRDRTIEPFRSRQLVAAWGGVARLVDFQEADHVSISHEPGYWPAIADFVRQLPGAPR